MVTKFERLETSLYPLIHHTFKATEIDSDELVEYYVRDLTVEETEQAIEMSAKYLSPYETFSLAARLLEKPAAFATLKAFEREFIKQKVSLGCYITNTNEMVGLNVLIVKSRSDDKKSVTSNDPDVINFIKVFDYFDENFNAFDHFDVDKCLYGVGLVVHPKYRGRGIATEILKARVPLLKAIGLTMTSTIFTGIHSQKAAVAAGYVEQLAVSYQKLQELFPCMDYSVANSTHCKTLSLKL